jgi:hypothetical protein
VRILSTIIGDALAGLSSLASMYTNKRLGLSVQLKSDETELISKPLARFVQRRFDIRGDLMDASDGASLLAGFLRYAERVVDHPSPDPTSAPSRVVDTDFARPAAPPAPDTRLLSEERPAPAAPAPVFVQSGGRRDREVGAGAVKDSLLGGM